MSATQKTVRLPPDDLLSAIFVLAERKKGEPLRFQGHDFDLQQIFGKLSGKHPILEKNYIFSNNGPLPYSPILNDSISRLQLSGLIGRENPDYHWVFLRPSAEAYFSQSLEPNLDENLKTELSDAAEAFLKELSH